MSSTLDLGFLCCSCSLLLVKVVICLGSNINLVLI